MLGVAAAIGRVERLPLGMISAAIGPRGDAGEELRIVLPNSAR